MKLHGRSSSFLAILVFLVALAGTSHAGKNAGGALIVHTNDAYTYSAQTVCTASQGEPASCQEAITRSDKSEGTVVWLLAAFPDTSNPAVSVVYFGVDYDDLNLDPGAAYKLCGPPGSLEVQDGDWPYTGRGNSVAFGSPVVGDRLFPFYVFKIDGGTDSSYFATAINPTGGYAAFVDDSTPPAMDDITRFGTVRWFTPGSNDCPSSGGDGGPDNPGGGGGVDEWLDGDGQRQWARDCILVQLRDDLPMPSRDPVDSLGLASFDALGRQLGLLNVRRLLMLDDETCSRYPGINRMAVLRFASGTDEMNASRRYAELQEVTAAQPNYFAPAVGLSAYANDPSFYMQWHLLGPGATTCRDPQYNPKCCEGCDIGVEVAWQYTRGDSAVRVAFLDTGADMQHPDLFDAYVVNPGEDDGDGVVELCPVDSLGDIGDVDGQGGADDDGNGIADDVLLGWALDFSELPTWKHRPLPHGTAVAGLLAAVTNNGTGVASAAGGDEDSLHVPGVRLIQFSAYSGITSDFLISTFNYAHEYGARLYSSSYAILLDDSFVRAAVDSLSDEMLFLQAVGNEATTDIIPFALLPNVMAVGGYDGITGGRWLTYECEECPMGSNYGVKLELMGPAADPDPRASYERMVMASTRETHHYNVEYECDPDWPDSIDCFGGTSAATPIAASVAALILSYSEEHGLGLTVNQVRKILTRTAEDIRCDPLLTECDCSDTSECVELLGRDEYSGYGRVDAGRALTLPVAALDPLAPYKDFVIWNGDVRFSWETLDLDPLNGGTPDHLELHYLKPEDGEGWHMLTDSLAWNGDPHFEWTVPDSFPVGENRYFRLSVVDSTGTVLNADYRRFTVMETTDVDGEEGVGSSVLGIWPNPSPNGARIRYMLAVHSEVRVEIFDVAGRRVKTLLHGRQSVGSKTVEWDGRDDSGHRVASGIYFIRLDLGSSTTTVRLVRIR